MKNTSTRNLIGSIMWMCDAWIIWGSLFNPVYKIKSSHIYVYIYIRVQNSRTPNRVSPEICAAAVWNLFHATLMVPRIVESLWSHIYIYIYIYIHTHIRPIYGFPHTHARTRSSALVCVCVLALIVPVFTVVVLCRRHWSWRLLFLFFMALQPPVGQGLLIVVSSQSHSVRHTTLGRTSADQGSASRRQNTQLTFMLPAWFEPAIPAREPSQPHALDSIRLFYRIGTNSSKIW